MDRNASKKSQMLSSLKNVENVPNVSRPLKILLRLFDILISNIAVVNSIAVFFTTAIKGR